MTRVSRRLLRIQSYDWHVSHTTISRVVQKNLLQFEPSQKLGTEPKNRWSLPTVRGAY